MWRHFFPGASVEIGHLESDARGSDDGVGQCLQADVVDFLVRGVNSL